MFGLRVIFVAALTAAGAWGSVEGYRFARTTDRLAVKKFVVHGAHRVTEAELIARARLTVGQNLLAIDLERAERLIASMPWVRSVKLSRRLPHTLDVQLTERSAAAMLAMGELYFVDVEGEPFKRVQPADGVDVPIVTGLEREAFEGRAPRGPQRLKLALEAARAWERSEAGKQEGLSEVRLTDEGATLVTASGLEVRLGDEAFDARLARLARVRAELEGRALTAAIVHLDNRARPSWITVQLSSAGLERGKPARK